MGLMVNSSQVVPAAAHGEEWESLSCSRVGSLPWEKFSMTKMSPSHRLWIPTNCYKVSHSSTGSVLQEPSQGHKSFQQTRTLLQHRLPSGSWPPLRHPPALVLAPAGAVGASLHPQSLCGLQGHSCLTVFFTMGFRGISDPEPGAMPAPPSPLTSVSAELLLSHTLTLLFSGHNYTCAITFFFFNILFLRHHFHF